MPNEYLAQIDWKHSEGLVSYEEALGFMEARVDGIIQGAEPPCVWFLQHPPLYTAGTSANAADMLDKERFPIYEAGRGGEYTYHGPGQLVVYVMLDLKQLFSPNAPDLRAYIQWLERWIIRSLSTFGVHGFTKEGMIGVWVDEENKKRSESVDSPALSASHVSDSMSRSGDIKRMEVSRPSEPSASEAAFHVRAVSEHGNIKKIAAIGVRVRKWVSFHGFCININPDLSHYAGIVPCGIKEYGVTSLNALGVQATLSDFKARLQKACD